ncbi:AMP-binding protein [Streptomyces xanthochromogenes]|uniref:class I adenylate-forming enzyme family protein n=1 Tax=Streptomyces xanthochromogenes TaxID=67384 RepID=UPI0034460BAA
MSESRRQLAGAVLTGGGRLDGHNSEATVACVNRCARRYEKAGIGDGDLVLLTDLAPDSLLVAVIACWSLGAAAWVSPRPREEVHTEPATFVVTAEQTPVPTVKWRGKPTGLLPEALALVHETSGSTGDTKLARRSVDSLLAECAGYRNGLQLVAADTVRIPVPVAHSFGSGVALSALLSGCRIDVRPIFTPAGVAADLDYGKVTKLAVTPALLNLLVQTRRRGESRPRVILAGAGLVSDGLDAECVTRFGVRVTRGYGSSETGGILIGPQGLGRPIPSVEIVQPDAGARGELVVRTATPVLGYVHEAIRTSLRWSTGDIVERDAAGQVWFLERKAGALRTNGRFVDTGPVHAVLSAVEGVDEVTFVVLPRAGRAEFEDVFAVVAGQRINRESVEEALRATATDGFAPRLRIFDELPRTDIGKLDRPALTERIRRDG